MKLSPEELAKGSLIGWAGHASRGKWVCPPHLALLARVVTEAASKPNARVIVSIPPRHGKSKLVSEHFPPWYLGRFPDRRVILASYESDFAASWGRKARDLFSEFGPPVFNERVRADVAARASWSVAGHEGGMDTCGVGGSATGKGADLLLIDDPVKNAEEANSPTFRKRAWAWFQAVAYTRLEPNGSIVLVMTRWHQDDLAGRLLEAAKAGGEQWEEIRLPAIAEKNDPLGRAPGEALWPARYNREALARIKKAVGSYVWSALYQQRPSPETGLHMKREWFRYYTEPSPGQFVLGSHGTVGRHNLVTFATVDLATSEEDEADYTAIATWGRDHLNRLLLLDLVRAQLPAPDIVPAMKRALARWDLSAIWVETAGFQLSILQTAWRANLPGRELKAKGNKLARFLPAIAAFEAERVWLPSSASWLADYESELLSFPVVTNDDQVDVTSYAVHVADQPEWSAVDASPPSATLTTSRPSIRPTLGGRS